MIGGHQCATDLVSVLLSILLSSMVETTGHGASQTSKRCWRIMRLATETPALELIALPCHVESK